MAAKNKQSKKSKAGSKVSFQPAKDDMEDENSGGEEGEDPAEDGRKDKGKKGEEEEFNLDDVLRLGGTQVSLPGIQITIIIQITVVIIIKLYLYSFHTAGSAQSALKTWQIKAHSLHVTHMHTPMAYTYNVKIQGTQGGQRYDENDTIK